MSRKYKIWLSVTGLLAVFVVIGAIGGATKKPSTNTSTPTSSSPSTAASSTALTPVATLTTPPTVTPTATHATVRTTSAGSTTSATSPAVPTSRLYIGGSALTGTSPAAGTCHARTATDGQPLPDAHCTPGAIDAAVTQANIHTTICVSGYTTKVRPPVSQTNAFKAADEKAYSISSGELDHLVPLELGGSSDAHNLWVEPGSIPNPKDGVENTLHTEVCAGQMTLAAAQLAIAIDWTVFLTTVPVPPPTAAPPVVAPTTAPAPQPATTVVHAGSFCSTAGATGVTSTGKPEVCKTSAKDSRLRWRAA